LGFDEENHCSRVREFRILQNRIDRAKDRLHFERNDGNGWRDGRRW